MGNCDCKGSDEYVSPEPIKASCVVTRDLGASVEYPTDENETATDVGVIGNTGRQESATAAGRVQETEDATSSDQEQERSDQSDAVTCRGDGGENVNGGWPEPEETELGQRTRLAVRSCIGVLRKLVWNCCVVYWHILCRRVIVSCRGGHAGRGAAGLRLPPHRECLPC